MWAKVRAALAAVTAVLMYLTGRRDGAAVQKEKSLKIAVRAARAAKQAGTKVRSLGNDAIHKRLRDKWLKK